MSLHPGRYAAHPFLCFTAVPGSQLGDFIDDRRAARLGAPSFNDRSWLDVRANSDGFYCPYDLPVQRAAGEREKFFIGVFGGSVAHWFALQQVTRLRDALASTELVGSREVVVLNLASAGHKQPQALMALNYFQALGQSFDAVIVLDGFNEAALSYRNWQSGFHPLAPSVIHLEASSVGVEGLRATEASMMDETELSRLVLDHWVNATRLMHDSCRARGIRMVHLLQPNQYHCQKPFSKAELSWAISSTTPYRAGVELIYPRMRKALTHLAREGYEVFDATTAFDHLEETIFSDNCCHYNARGNDTLGDIVLDALSMSDTPCPQPVSSQSPVDPVETPSGQGDTDDIYPFW